MAKFNNKVLIIGFGSVAKCALPMLLKLVEIPYKNITVIDMRPHQPEMNEWEEKGITFIRRKITRENMGSLLGEYIGNGDLLIDLAWNIDCCEILDWCHNNGVRYLNTSVELWDPYEGANAKDPTERTLYFRQMKIRAMKAGWKNPGPSAVIEHGANPGMISHFAKQAVADISAALLADNKITGSAREQLEQAIKDKAFNKMARLSGVKVIHVSERDTQISDKPKLVNEFVNTWSVEGFREEGVAPAEMGWGTHEKELPRLAVEHKTGPKNQICLARMGMNTWVRSWVPDYNIRGMIIRHGEAFSLSDYLTVWENGKAVYRPTVHYAYCPADAAIASLQELRGYNYELQAGERIMRDEIIAGEDILGALVMGHEYNSWWTGSILDIGESRRLIPHQNATTIQVAIGVCTAIMWMLENPELGLLMPEDIPHDFVLGIAKPWLGKFVSEKADWTPLKNFKNAFASHNGRVVDEADPWQFKNFLIEEGE